MWWIVQKNIVMNTCKGVCTREYSAGCACRILCPVQENIMMNMYIYIYSMYSTIDYRL